MSSKKKVTRILFARYIFGSIFRTSIFFMKPTFDCNDAQLTDGVTISLCSSYRMTNLRTNCARKCI